MKTGNAIGGIFERETMKAQFAKLRQIAGNNSNCARALFLRAAAAAASETCVCRFFIFREHKRAEAVCSFVRLTKLFLLLLLLLSLV
jgi:hypothetical protein